MKTNACVCCTHSQPAFVLKCAKQQQATALRGGFGSRGHRNGLRVQPSGLLAQQTGLGSRTGIPQRRGTSWATGRQPLVDCGVGRGGSARRAARSEILHTVCNISFAATGLRCPATSPPAGTRPTITGPLTVRAAWVAKTRSAMSIQASSTCRSAGENSRADSWQPAPCWGENGNGEGRNGHWRTLDAFWATPAAPRLEWRQTPRSARSLPGCPDIVSGDSAGTVPGRTASPGSGLLGSSPAQERSLLRKDGRLFRRELVNQEIPDCVRSQTRLADKSTETAIWGWRWPVGIGRHDFVSGRCRQGRYRAPSPWG